MPAVEIPVLTKLQREAKKFGVAASPEFRLRVTKEVASKAKKGIEVNLTDNDLQIAQEADLFGEAAALILQAKNDRIWNETSGPTRESVESRMLDAIMLMPDNLTHLYASDAFCATEQNRFSREAAVDPDQRRALIEIAPVVWKKIQEVKPKLEPTQGEKKQKLDELEVAVISALSRIVTRQPIIYAHWGYARILDNKVLAVQALEKIKPGMLANADSTKPELNPLIRMLMEHNTIDNKARIAAEFKNLTLDQSYNLLQAYMESCKALSESEKRKIIKVILDNLRESIHRGPMRENPSVKRKMTALMEPPSKLDDEQAWREANDWYWINVPAMLQSMDYGGDVQLATEGLHLAKRAMENGDVKTMRLFDVGIAGDGTSTPLGRLDLSEVSQDILNALPNYIRGGHAPAPGEQERLKSGGRGVVRGLLENVPSNDRRRVIQNILESLAHGFTTIQGKAEHMPLGALSDEGLRIIAAAEKAVQAEPGFSLMRQLNISPEMLRKVFGPASESAMKRLRKLGFSIY